MTDWLPETYLATTIETIGVERTIIALQLYARQAHRNVETCMRLKSDPTLWQHNSAWASRIARIMMGIEER